jgi:hypothetical protein
VQVFDAQQITCIISIVYWSHRCILLVPQNENDFDLQLLPRTLCLLYKDLLACAIQDTVYIIQAGGAPCPSSPKVWWGLLRDIVCVAIKLLHSNVGQVAS